MLKEGQQIVRCIFETLVLCLQRQREDERLQELVLSPPLIRQPWLPGNVSGTLPGSKSKRFRILKSKVQILKEMGGVVPTDTTTLVHARLQSRPSNFVFLGAESALRFSLGQDLFVLAEPTGQISA